MYLHALAKRRAQIGLPIIKGEIRTNPAKKGLHSLCRRPYRQTSASAVNARGKTALKEGARRTFIAFRGKMSVREDTDACGRRTNIKNDADELNDNSFEITIRDGTPETAVMKTLNATIDR